jgi:hypothetical protein
LDSTLEYLSTENISPTLNLWILLEELIGAVERSEIEVRMSKSDMRTVLWLMGMVYGKLYKRYEEFKETTMVIDEMLMTAVDKAELEGEARGREEGIMAILDLLAQGKSIRRQRRSSALSDCGIPLSNEFSP